MHPVSLSTFTIPNNLPLTPQTQEESSHLPFRPTTPPPSTNQPVNATHPCPEYLVLAIPTSQLFSSLASSQSQNPSNSDISPLAFPIASFPIPMGSAQPLPSEPEISAPASSSSSSSSVTTPPHSKRKAKESEEENIDKKEVKKSRRSSYKGCQGQKKLIEAFWEENKETYTQEYFKSNGNKGVKEFGKAVHAKYPKVDAKRMDSVKRFLLLKHLVVKEATPKQQTAKDFIESQHPGKSPEDLAKIGLKPLHEQYLTYCKENKIDGLKTKALFSESLTQVNLWEPQKPGFKRKSSQEKIKETAITPETPTQALVVL